jgi:hypothetical protein
MVDGREGASEDTHQRRISTVRDDGQKNVRDGRSRLSASTGAEHARSAGVAPIGGVR